MSEPDGCESLLKGDGDGLGTLIATSSFFTWTLAGRYRSSNVFDGDKPLNDSCESFQSKKINARTRRRSTNEFTGEFQSYTVIGNEHFDNCLQFIFVTREKSMSRLGQRREEPSTNLAILDHARSSSSTLSRKSRMKHSLSWKRQTHDAEYVKVQARHTRNSQ